MRQTNDPAKVNALQGLDYRDVADGLIGLADALQEQVTKLRRDAREVRAGRYLADFAYASGRNVRYAVERAIEAELPQAWDAATYAACQRAHAAEQRQRRA